MKIKLTIFLCLFWSINMLQSQVDYDLVKASTEKLFINNVWIKKSADVPASFGSITIDKGKFQGIGSVSKPFDAKELKCDSMYAYPGFIAGISHAGIKKPEEKKGESVKIKFKGAPPNQRAGITPERKAVDYFNYEEGSLSKFREAGFTLVNSAPQGKMFPGQSSLFTTNANSNSASVIKEDVAMLAQFKSASGMYPSTIIAIMAKYRDLINNAKNAGKYISSYQLNPTQGARPDYDEATLALVNVSQFKMPVFQRAEKVRDIYRAIELKKELGFDMVLTEVKQGGKISNEIKRYSSGLLISSDLPKEAEEIDEEDDERTEEEKAFDERKNKSIEEYIGQAAALEQAGIEFGFSFIDSKPGDFHKNLKRMHKAGLSEQAVLKALTSYPAKLLGVNQFAGSIDQGKLGNLVIMDKPILEEDAKIKYVIVEGKVFEYNQEEEKKKKVDDGELVDIIGTWDYEVDVFGETQEGKMVISGEEENLEVKIYGEDDDDPSIAENIKRDGNDLSFDFEAETDGGNLDLEMSISFSGDEFSGSVKSDFGALSIEGTKSPEK